VIAADLGDSGERGRVASEIDELGLTVEILVNNAGFGTFGPFHEQDRGRQLDMVRLNVEAVVDFESRYLADMVSRGRGAVINIASTASFQPLPTAATYSAGKAFVRAHSEAIHTELKGTGVTVTAVCPGPVKTEFIDAAELGDVADQAPGLFWTSVEQVAKDAVDGAEHGKRTVIPGRLNQLGAVTSTHTPHTLLMPVLRRFSGRMRY
jgi:short-subunit dehydrogenase